MRPILLPVKRSFNHGFLPLVTQQADPTRSTIAGVIAVLLTVLACVWSIRAIVRDRRQFLLSINSDSLQPTQESFSRPSVGFRKRPSGQGRDGGPAYKVTRSDVLEENEHEAPVHL